MVTIRRSILLAVGVLALAMVLAGGLLSAKDGEGEGKESEKALNLLLAPDVVIRQDSLFASIRIGYDGLKPILEKSCFDCHSKFTTYPWYHKIPGVKQLLDSDIKEGREHLDLSDGFPFRGKGSLPEILGDMKSEIAEGEMPLFLYRVMHWGTDLSDARRDSVITWLDSAQTLVMRFYDQERIPYEKPQEEN